MCICEYVYVCVCVYVCMYVYVYIYLYVWMILYNIVVGITIELQEIRLDFGLRMDYGPCVYIFQ